VSHSFEMGVKHFIYDYNHSDITFRRSNYQAVKYKGRWPLRTLWSVCDFLQTMTIH